MLIIFPRRLADSCSLCPTHCLDAQHDLFLAQPFLVSPTFFFFFYYSSTSSSVLGPLGDSHNLGSGKSSKVVCTSSLPQSIFYTVIREVLISANVGLSEFFRVICLTKPIFFFSMIHPCHPYFVSHTLCSGSSDLVSPQMHNICSQLHVILHPGPLPQCLCLLTDSWSSVLNSFIMCFENLSLWLSKI